METEDRWSGDHSLIPWRPPPRDPEARRHEPLVPSPSRAKKCSKTCPVAQQTQLIDGGGMAGRFAMGEGATQECRRCLQP